MESKVEGKKRMKLPMCVFFLFRTLQVRFWDSGFYHFSSFQGAREQSAVLYPKKEENAALLSISLLEKCSKNITVMIDLFLHSLL